MHLYGELTLEVADKAALRWAQRMVTEYHYLHAPVDMRGRPLCYLLHHQASWGADAAAGPRCVGIVMASRPEATRCYQGGLTYGGLDDVRAGRARYDRWEVLNISRVWLHPHVQWGGKYHRPEEIPGYTDRRGVWRSTLASALLRAILGRVGFDYLRAHPPVDCDQPYQIRAVLSYCDTRLHKGTIYRASGFELARTNERGVETWFTPAVAPLTPAQDAEVRELAERSPRARRIRAARSQLTLGL
jgi:hypothetical protein